MDLLKILAICGSVMILVMVIELIRRGRLKERYALLWLFACVALLVFSLFRGLLDTVSHFLGIVYPPSFLFLLAFSFLLLITLHFSTVISKLSEQNKKLTQEIALLRQEMQEAMNKTTVKRGKE